MSVYSELRPHFTGEATYAATLTLDGTGSIAGQVFAGELLDPSGDDAGSVTVVIADATARTIAVTFAGQDDAGDFRWTIRRTDLGAAEVVATGVLEVLDPES